MKRILAYISSALIFCTAGNANQYFAEFRASYFYPTDSLFRDVYTGGFLSSVEVDFQMWKMLYAWVGVSYFSHSGESVPDEIPGHVRFVPINAGVKAIFYQTDVWRPYIGAGAMATYLQIKNESPYFIESNSGWGPGGIFKAGLLINPMNSFLIDIYVDYLLQTVSLDHKDSPYVLIQDASISGFSFGGALGVQF